MCVIILVCVFPRSLRLPMRSAVIRLRLAEILKTKGWTPYRLSQVTGLTAPTCYRLADPKMQFGRFTADTLDRLCEALEVQPGDLLEFVPDPPHRGR